MRKREAVNVLMDHDLKRYLERVAAEQGGSSIASVVRKIIAEAARDAATKEATA
jgi:hypothetical protein